MTTPTLITPESTMITLKNKNRANERGNDTTKIDEEAGRNDLPPLTPPVVTTTATTGELDFSALLKNLLEKFDKQHDKNRAIRQYITIHVSRPDASQHPVERNTDLRNADLRNAGRHDRLNQNMFPEELPPPPLLSVEDQSQVFETLIRRTQDPRDLKIAHIEENSIDNFDQLSKAFLKYYSMYIVRGVSSADMWALSQGSSESLRKFMGCFKATVSRITVEDEAAISMLQKAL